LITVQEVKDFLNAPDYPDTIVQTAIDLAQNRIKKLLGLTDADPIPDTPEAKKALILLAAAEIASQTNLYWKRGDNYELINAKNLVAEAERLLGVVPERGSMVWTTLSG